MESNAFSMSNLKSRAVVSSVERFYASLDVEITVVNAFSLLESWLCRGYDLRDDSG